MYRSTEGVAPKPEEVRRRCRSIAMDLEDDAITD